MMDVLRPPLIHIGGRIYRRNPVSNEPDEEDVHYRMEDDIDTSDRMYEDEVCDAFTQIEEVDNGYRLKLSIPSAYFKYIIGKKGESKKRLENETRTQVKIPKVGQEGDIVIVGRDRKGVISAKTRIEITVDSARQRQPFTHFLSIPITTDEIKAGFDEFREDVLHNCDGEVGVDGTIFQNPSKLHLTLGTLALMSEAEVEQANEVLQGCLHDIIEPMLGGTALMADVQGLEYMNDDPGSVDVLYAKVKLQDGSARLQQVVEALVDRFVTAGLLSREYDRVKLHVTVMNTLMRKDPTGTTEPTRDRQGRPIKSQEREAFDATRVLELFGAYLFGQIHINTVHLSKRYTTGKDGYYGCAGSISLP